jgi:hypothetical protein
MQQEDSDQQREFGVLAWIVLRGPDGTPDGTPVLVNDGPSDLVTGTAGPIAAGRYRFTLTSGGQEYSDIHDCEGGTEDKPQRIDVVTSNQQRDLNQQREFRALTWIEVHGPGSIPDGTQVLVNNGSSKFVIGRAGSITPGRYRFTLTSTSGQEYSDHRDCPPGGTRDDPHPIEVITSRSV